MKKSYDVQVANEGTIVSFDLLSLKAQAWVTEHVHDALFFGGRLACEPRYAYELAQGMLDDGLTVV